MFRHLGTRIIVLVSGVIAVGLLSISLHFARTKEQAIIEQNEATVLKLAESVSRGIRTVMLAGYADIAQGYADGLKKVRGIEDFRILRTNGVEAFLDNKTIQAVNRRRGEEEFFERDAQRTERVVPRDHPDLMSVLSSRQPRTYYDWDLDGTRLFTVLAPIENDRDCHKCHGSDSDIRGLIKLTTSMAPVDREVQETWREMLVMLALLLLGTIAVTWLVVNRSVIRPITRVTSAMQRASQGDLSQQIPVPAQDEVGHMAESFNRMINQLLRTHTGLRSEQDKLTTIILSAREGIVVTDSSGAIVLVNPAAAEVLGKTAEEITHAGLLQIFNDVELMENLIREGRDTGTPTLLDYNGLTLSVYVSTIRNDHNGLVGTAALIRDITEEQRLQRDLLAMSVTDPLTGLFNRRHLDSTLGSEFARCTRYNQALSVLMLDIDHFKAFNDDFGHETGDQVLQMVAKAAAKDLRKVDVACRYGGEEFAIILPHTPPQGAHVTAERIRQAVAALPPIGDRGVTVSIGVASHPFNNCSDPESLIEAADRALYRAKESGRNRVCMAEE